MNELHEAKDAERFKCIEIMSPQDLYFIMLYGQDEIYTSSYKHSFTRMLQRLGKNSKTDSLLQVVNYDFFKRFIKMAANFNRLDTFLKLMHVAKSEQIMKLFVDNLDKTNKLEEPDLDKTNKIDDI